MLDFVTLTCPSCGGKLQITNDIERFACAHCGREHLVKRAGGIVSLSPLVDGLKKVEIGVDKTAAELALVRLRKECSALEEQIHIVVFSSISFTNQLKSLLQKMGKVSFMENLFLKNDNVRKWIESLSEDELGTAIGILEGRSVWYMKQQTIDELTTLKNLQIRLRKIRSRIDENQRIVDM